MGSVAKNKLRLRIILIWFLFSEYVLLQMCITLYWESNPRAVVGDIL